MNIQFIQPCPSYITNHKPASAGQKVHFCSSKDTFVSSSIKNTLPEGIKSIKNVQQGFFSSICDGSIPLENLFNKFISGDEQISIISRGLSTNTRGISHSFLKSSADNPLSTSNVHDCSVLYLFNKETNTHFLYHAGPQTDSYALSYMMRTFMPEGFSHASIVPGDNAWTLTHRITLGRMFGAVKENNPNATVNVYHQSSFYPEIAGLKGKMYEIPNCNINQKSMGKIGQASFKIQDLQGENTLDIILQEGITSDKLAEIKESFEAQDIDIEIKKVLNSIIDRRTNEIKEIESCQSLAEVDNLINKYPPRYVLSHFSSFELQKNKLNSAI